MMLFKCCASVNINKELTYDIWFGHYRNDGEARNAAFRRAIELQHYVWDDIGKEIPAMLDWKVEVVDE